MAVEAVPQDLVEQIRKAFLKEVDDKGTSCKLFPYYYHIEIRL